MLETYGFSKSLPSCICKNQLTFPWLNYFLDICCSSSYSKESFLFLGSGACLGGLLNHLVCRSFSGGSRLGSEEVDILRLPSFPGIWGVISLFLGNSLPLCFKVSSETVHSFTITHNGGFLNICVLDIWQSRRCFKRWQSYQSFSSGEWGKSDLIILCLWVYTPVNTHGG